MLLRLAFSPKVDQDYPKLVALWTFAFTKAIGKIKQDLDEDRINKAFGESTHKLTSWPSPAQIIALMPRRPHQEKISHVPVHDPELARKALAIAYELIDGKITKEQADRLMDKL